MNETDLLHTFIERVPFALPDWRVFRRNIINVETKQGFRVRNGIKGQSDAYALGARGRHVEIETKAARGTLRTEQEAWRAFCLRMHIPHLVLKARAAETPDDTVNRWIAELREAIADV